MASGPPCRSRTSFVRAAARPASARKSTTRAAYNGGIEEADVLNYYGEAGYYQTILNTLGTTLPKVTGQAGTSTTLLVGHKILQPVNYNGGSPKDLGYTNVVKDQTGYDHMRWCDTYAGGTNAHRGVFMDNNGVDENHFGGPHPGGSPFLWGDGSVSMYTYGYSTGGLSDDAVFQLFWAFNRSIPVTQP